MSVAISVSPTLRVGPKVNVSMIPISIVFTAETYATATGGLALDLETFLATHGIAWADVVGGIGITTLGWLAKFIKGAAAADFTVELWNGITEAADGATTATVQGFLFYVVGSPNE